MSYHIQQLNKVFCYVRSSCLSSNNLGKITCRHQTQLFVRLLFQKCSLPFVHGSRCDVLSDRHRTSLTHAIDSHTGLFIARRLVRDLNHQQHISLSQLQTLSHRLQRTHKNINLTTLERLHHLTRLSTTNTTVDNTHSSTQIPGHSSTSLNRVTVVRKNNSRTIPRLKIQTQLIEFTPARNGRPGLRVLDQPIRDRHSVQGHRTSTRSPGDHLLTINLSQEILLELLVNPLLVPTHRRLNGLSGHLGKIQAILTTTPQKPITQVGINKLQVMFTRVPRRKLPTRVRTSQQDPNLLSMLRPSLKIRQHNEPTLHPPPVRTQISTRLSTLREHRL